MISEKKKKKPSFSNTHPKHIPKKVANLTRIIGTGSSFFTQQLWYMAPDHTRQTRSNIKGSMWPFFCKYQYRWHGEEGLGTLDNLY